MAQILLFRVEGEKLRKIRFLAMKLGIFVRTVPDTELGRTLAELTGREAASETQAEFQPIDGEMLVMDELSSFQFNSLLEGLRRERVPIALKAIVTEQNLQWTAAALYRELAAEHAAMRRAAGNPIHRKDN